MWLNFYASVWQSEALTVAFNALNIGRQTSICDGYNGVKCPNLSSEKKTTKQVKLSVKAVRWNNTKHNVWLLSLPSAHAKLCVMCHATAILIENIKYQRLKWVSERPVWVWAAKAEFRSAWEENESSQRRRKSNKKLILESWVVDYSVRKCLSV